MMKYRGPITKTWVARFASAALLSILLTSCSSASQPPLPAIATGLQKNTEIASHAFDQRVKREFPVGSSVATLRDEVLAQKFEILDDEHKQLFRMDHDIAVYQRSGFPCSVNYAIEWKTTEDHRIAKISGSAGLSCI